MFESPAQLAEKIRLGEDSFLELKEVQFAGTKVSAPHRDGLADALAAFANSRGGVCVLGVEDSSRRVLGVPLDKLDAAERFVREVCEQSVEPPIDVVIERVFLRGEAGEERAVLRVDVPPSLFVHKSPGGYLLRVGAARRQLRPDHLARLFQERSQARLIRFDEQTVPETAISDLDHTLIDRFRTPHTRDDPRTLLRKLGMGREDDRGEFRPTVAGVLLGAAHPERWLKHAFIQSVAYRGDKAPGAGDLRSYQLDARDITGPLDQQVVEACHFVVRNMRVGATKTLGRHDVPQYDLTAVFEALVNAVAHRDYSMYGAKIRLRMFANRLEIYSPGPLANTMTVESLPLRQVNRNEALTSLLAKCPVPRDIEWLDTPRSTLMDRRGEGVSVILERSEQLSGKRPVYELPDDSELKLTIFAADPGAVPVA